MKKLIVAIITLITLFAATSQAHSTDRVLAGTLIGAGSGALIGQAIGGDSESTVLGTAIGGVVGFTAGSLHNQHLASSSFYFGFNNSYPERYHRPYKNHGNYYPRHHAPRHHYYYPKVHRYDRHHYYHPRNRDVVRHEYRDNHRYNRNDGRHSPRHNGNSRERRSQRR